MGKSEDVAITGRLNYQKRQLEKHIIFEYLP